jgi:hypothetical protein
MRRESFELTESLLPENPLEGLDPEPDVLANITARARARRRGEIEETPVTRNQERDSATAGAEPEPKLVYFSATLEDGPVRFVNAAGEPLSPDRQAELAREHGALAPTGGNGQSAEIQTKREQAIPQTGDSPASAPVRRGRKEPAHPAEPESERTQPDTINRESIRASNGSTYSSPDIDLDDPHLMSGTHATTLRIDWEVIQGLKRIARDLSRPRKECTMGMLILHALKQTYPDLFEKP